MGSTIAAIIAIGVLIMLHEAGHYAAARWAGMKVRRFAVGFGPALAKVVRNGTEFRVGAVPLGGYVLIDGMNPHDGSDPKAPESYAAKPFHLRFATIFAGPLTNYLLGFALLFAFYAFFFAEPLAPVRVLQVVDASPASAAGLKTGDLLIGTSSRAFDLAAEVRSAIQEGGARSSLVLLVDRGGQRIHVPIKPDGTGGTYRVGIQYEGTGRREKPMGVGAGAVQAWDHMWASSRALVTAVGTLLSGLFIPSERGKVDVSGPIGMVQVLARRTEASWSDGLQQLAEISVMLGIANLLPIPGLDGSRLMFLILGLVRRKEISPKVETVVHAVGIALLLGFLVLVSIADVRR